MRYALTAEAMRGVEDRAVAEEGLTLGGLMEHAGRSVAEHAARLAPEGAVRVVAGTGNNGGDGWVAARELWVAGREVAVIAPSEPSAPLAAEAFRAAVDAGVPWTVPAEAFDLARALEGAALVVDALFGFGFHGAATGREAAAVIAADDADAPVLSVDVPSGVDASTGAVEGPAVHAAVTLTFTAPKTGLLIHPGAQHAGEVVVADIGIPRALADAASGVELWDLGDLRAALPLPAPDAHKASLGRVLVVAGSTDYPGAAVLAARGALRSGAGYVVLAAPAAVRPVLQSHLTAEIVTALPDTPDGSLAAAARDAVLAMSARFDAVVLGPGLGRHAATADVVVSLVERLTLPLVLDADALNALAAADVPSLLGARRAPTVLTPHPAEAARLLGVSTGIVQSDRLVHAESLAGDGRACLLKGARSAVAGTGRRSLVLPGNPGMATAGTGDVLAGMTGTLLAQGLPPYEAATLAAHLHALAGDAAAAALTETCMTAEDLLDHLPSAMKEVLGRSDR